MSLLWKTSGNSERVSGLNGGAGDRIPGLFSKGGSPEAEAESRIGVGDREQQGLFPDFLRAVFFPGYGEIFVVIDVKPYSGPLEARAREGPMLRLKRKIMRVIEFSSLFHLVVGGFEGNPEKRSARIVRTIAQSRWLSVPRRMLVTTLFNASSYAVSTTKGHLIYHYFPSDALRCDIIESILRIKEDSYQGIFPDTAGPIRESVFSFAHLDVDTYQSTLSCLEFLYPENEPRRDHHFS